jgi:hypothetical protein
VLLINELLLLCFCNNYLHSLAWPLARFSTQVMFLWPSGPIPILAICVDTVRVKIQLRYCLLEAPCPVNGIWRLCLANRGRDCVAPDLGRFLVSHSSGDITRWSIKHAESCHKVPQPTGQQESRKPKRVLAADSLARSIGIYVGGIFG